MKAALGAQSRRGGRCRRPWRTRPSFARSSGPWSIRCCTGRCRWARRGTPCRPRQPAARLRRCTRAVPSSVADRLFQTVGMIRDPRSIGHKPRRQSLVFHCIEEVAYITLSLYPHLTVFFQNLHSHLCLRWWRRYPRLRHILLQFAEHTEEEGGQ